MLRLPHEGDLSPSDPCSNPTYFCCGRRLWDGRAVVDFQILVPKAGFEPAHPGGRQTLNLVRLPFRHFGTLKKIIVFYGKRVKLKDSAFFYLY